MLHDVDVIDDYDDDDDMLQVALRCTSSIPSGEDRMLHNFDGIDDYDDDDDNNDDDDDDDDDDMLQAGREVHQ